MALPKNAMEKLVALAFREVNYSCSNVVVVSEFARSSKSRKQLLTYIVLACVLVAYIRGSYASAQFEAASEANVALCKLK